MVMVLVILCLILKEADCGYSGRGRDSVLDSGGDTVNP